MDGTFVEELADRLSRPQVLTVNGIEHLVRPAGGEERFAWVREELETPDLGPKAVAVHTLQALVGYVGANRDRLALDRCVVHVVDPVTVRLCGPLGPPPFHQRHTYVEATYTPPVRVIGAGTFVDPESAMIALLVECVPGEARDAIQRLLANLSTERVATSQDDGLSQKVMAKLGVVTVGEQTVRNPIHLAPRRTFPEVEQPASALVVRFRGGGEEALPQVGFFEADGGAWRLDAVRTVAAWLRRELEDETGAASDVVVLA